MDTEFDCALQMYDDLDFAGILSFCNDDAADSIEGVIVWSLFLFVFFYRVVNVVVYWFMYKSFWLTIAYSLIFIWYQPIVFVFSPPKLVAWSWWSGPLFCNQTPKLWTQFTKWPAPIWSSNVFDSNRIVTNNAFRAVPYTQSVFIFVVSETDWHWERCLNQLSTTPEHHIYHYRYKSTLGVRFEPPCDMLLSKTRVVCK